MLAEGGDLNSYFTISDFSSYIFQSIQVKLEQLDQCIRFLCSCKSERAVFDNNCIFSIYQFHLFNIQFLKVHVNLHLLVEFFVTPHGLSPNKRAT